jgi:excisionase family DNA binding protein
MALLTPEQVAEILSVSPEWVRECARRGDIASIKLGHYRRFEQSDVDAFIASRRVVSAPERVRQFVSPNKETTNGKA